jgi:hypothetical protein
MDKHVVEESAPIGTEEETTSDMGNGAVGAPATSGSSLPANGGNGDTPTGYLGRAALKRVQCGIFGQNKEL